MGKIIYYLEAQKDLQDIFDYISDTWKVPSTAAKIVTSIYTAINDLNHMPERYKLFDVEPWTSRNLRYFFVKNYTIFYIYNKDEDTINILRIVYQSTNYLYQLNSSEHYFVSDHDIEEMYNENLSKEKIK